MERLYFAFEAEGKVRLSEEEKNALRSFSKYQEEIEKLQTAKADSATIKAYTKEQETVIKPQIEIIEQLIARDGLLNEYMTGQMYVNAINNSMAIIDSLQMDKDLREILKTKCYNIPIRNCPTALSVNLKRKLRILLCNLMFWSSNRNMIKYHIKPSNIRKA